MRIEAEGPFLPGEDLSSSHPPPVLIADGSFRDPELGQPVNVNSAATAIAGGGYTALSKPLSMTITPMPPTTSRSRTGFPRQNSQAPQR
jgi:hypothetical protein